eukprot:3421933-Prymnesium_polylepis.1
MPIHADDPVRLRSVPSGRKLRVEPFRHLGTKRHEVSAVVHQNESALKVELYCAVERVRTSRLYLGQPIRLIHMQRNSLLDCAEDSRVAGVEIVDGASATSTSMW